jgi:hypothetical protein
LGSSAERDTGQGIGKLISRRLINPVCLEIRANLGERRKAPPEHLSVYYSLVGGSENLISP